MISHGPLPFFVSWESVVTLHDSIPGVPNVRIQFTSPTGTPAPRLVCTAEEGTDDPWLLDCGEDTNIVKTDDGFRGRATADIHGAFLSPTSLRMDLRYQIIDCGDPPRCEPYIMDCVMEYSTFYEAD